MVTASSNYKQIKRGGRAYRSELHPEYVQMVLTVRDARGCTVRGAHELLVRTASPYCSNTALDTVPKDDWLGIVCDALGIDVKTLLNNAQNEADKKSLTNTTGYTLVTCYCACPPTSTTAYTGNRQPPAGKEPPPGRGAPRTIQLRASWTKCTSGSRIGCSLTLTNGSLRLRGRQMGIGVNIGYHFPPPDDLSWCPRGACTVSTNSNAHRNVDFLRLKAYVEYAFNRLMEHFGCSRCTFCNKTALLWQDSVRKNKVVSRTPC